MVVARQKFRIEAFGGGRIDRGRPVRFSFNGRAMFGFLGDTLASALLANGVRLVGRSFKYHRRRGFLSVASEEANGLVQLGEGALSEPNMVATRIELFDGLVATSQNAFPSVEFDILGLNSLFGSLLPSGFYYKTFMWPQNLWMRYEALIRRIAGLGRAPRCKDPEHYERRHAHCDVLVAGGGASGLMAAWVAAMSGAEVIIADEDSEFGGGLHHSSAIIDDKPAMFWVLDMVATLAAMDNVTLLRRTTVTGYYDYNFLTALERVSDHLSPQTRQDKIRRRFWKIRAAKVILAQGCIERPLVFADNDRVGVMLASAVRQYLRRYQTLCGQNAVVFGNNDSVYGCAFDLKASGAEVAIVDIRDNLSTDLIAEANALDISVYQNSSIVAVKGKRRLSGVDIRELTPDGKDVCGEVRHVSCDLVAMGGGYTPSVHLFSQARGKLSYDSGIGAFVPHGHVADGFCVGAGAGIFDLDAALKDATSKAQKACGELGLKSKKIAPPTNMGGAMTASIRLLWELPASGHGKAFVDFQNDVTTADIKLAQREGYESVEHLKRYTTTGMGTDQGKTSNMNALALLAECRGIGIESVGTTTFRPPYTGVTFGAIAGRNRDDLFMQERGTAMHAAHCEAGAVFEDVGDWKRPRYFPVDGEDMHQAVQRECLAARRGVGMLDASTLGKIDIQGKDAVRLLNMLYTNAWDSLGIGCSRYGVMLNEDGMIFDDGVTTRLGEQHFHMTTTTGGAARVLNWLEEWLQTEWPHWQVYCTSVTEQWAVATITGPKARLLLASLSDIDLSAEAFGFMRMREGHVGGIPARIFRISFTGDLAFEINVPARYGLALWYLLMEAGRAYDLCLYGTECMHVLRAEKGFIIVGQDTDGTMTPYDAGLGWLVSSKKSDFLGKRSLSRSDTSRSDRKQLVGVRSLDARVVLAEGAHLVESLRDAPPMDMLGHVTSSYFSPNCGHSIAFAAIKNGFKRRGQSYSVPLMDGTVHAVSIADSMVFFDAKKERQDG